MKSFIRKLYYDTKNFFNEKENLFSEKISHMLLNFSTSENVLYKIASDNKQIYLKKKIGNRATIHNFQNGSDLIKMLGNENELSDNSINLLTYLLESDISKYEKNKEGVSGKIFEGFVKNEKNISNVFYRISLVENPDKEITMKFSQKNSKLSVIEYSSSNKKINEIIFNNLSKKHELKKDVKRDNRIINTMKTYEFGSLIPLAISAFYGVGYFGSLIINNKADIYLNIPPLLAVIAFTIHSALAITILSPTEREKEKDKKILEIKELGKKNSELNPDIEMMAPEQKKQGIIS